MVRGVYIVYNLHGLICDIEHNHNVTTRNEPIDVDVCIAQISIPSISWFMYTDPCHNYYYYYYYYYYYSCLKISTIANN